MRIVGGEFRGRRLAAVGKGDAGAHLRPTTDRVRESLFNLLLGGRFGDPVEDAHVLELLLTLLAGHRSHAACTCHRAR